MHFESCSQTEKTFPRSTNMQPVFDIIIYKAEDTRGRKPAPIFGVQNRSRFCMTHVPKVGSDFRLQKSAPVFDPVCLQP